MRRTLEYAGYKVRHIMNITDVDDKTIRASRAAGKSLKEFTRYYENFFKADLKKLNISYPEKFTRATEHVSEMIKVISALLERGLAYKTDGSVYFDISKFKPYGKLAHLDLKGLKAGARVDVDEYTKENVQDFVLWKAYRSGEPYWSSPFGRGRPGWHIECSAMSTKYLGQPFDLHAAAVDLIFPHHENEIAQSEGASGKEFVRYWMHGEHLLVNGKKMAKSLGNVFSLRDIENHGFNPSAFRYLILTSHYRSKLNFTWESLEAAQNSLERLYDFVINLKSQTSILKSKTVLPVRRWGDKYRKRFENAIFNDLDTPKALSVTWDLLHEYNKNPSRYNPKDVLTLLYEFDRVFGVGFDQVRPGKNPAEVVELLKKREEYRQKGEWQKADAIRAAIKKLGYLV